MRGDPPDELDALIRAVRGCGGGDELRALLAPLLRRAHEDALTRLANRGAFEAALEREIERARRYSRSLALLVCDLDAFKARNDRGGHTAGDAALVRVGATLRGLSRASDLAARIGGDEFAVLLPETGPTGACAFADKLLRALCGDPLDPLALSIGIATLPEDALDAKALFELADRRLYDAKALGGALYR
jgi:diguanylate cyclase (GGDEF)-like protein